MNERWLTFDENRNCLRTSQKTHLTSLAGTANRILCEQPSLCSFYCSQPNTYIISYHCNTLWALRLCFGSVTTTFSSGILLYDVFTTILYSKLWGPITFSFLDFLSSNLLQSLTWYLCYTCSQFHSQTVIKKHILKAALKRGVETGTLVQVKNSYKLSAEAKKPVKAKKPAAAAKKAAPKKKVRLVDAHSGVREPLSMLILSFIVLRACFSFTNRL